MHSCETVKQHSAHIMLLLVLVLRCCCCACPLIMQGGDLYSALRHHSETMKWERLGRKVALDVALGLNYLHAQV